MTNLEYLIDAAKSDIGLDESSYIVILDKPNFNDTSLVNNWRNYIPKIIKKQWHQLSIESRLVFWWMAEKQADAEEWD